MAYIIPPYHIPEKYGLDRQDLSDLSPFFHTPNCSSIEEITKLVAHQLLSSDIPSDIMRAIQRQNPNKLLLPSSYLLGKRGEKIVTLTSKPYGMLAIPGGKSDGGTIAEILEKHWTTLQLSFDNNDLSIIMRDLHRLRTPHIFAKLSHWLSSRDMRDNRPENRYDKKVMDLLRWNDPTVQQLLVEKLVGIKKTDRLSVLLDYKQETIEEILHREYCQETGRKIINKKLLFVQLEEKGTNMLKVRFYFTGEVDEKDENAILHTHKEQIGKRQQKELHLGDAVAMSKTLLLQKFGAKEGYQGNSNLQHKKLSAAFGHWLALELAYCS